MFGLIAIEMTKAWVRPVICTSSQDGRFEPMRFNTRAEAQAEAASVTAWYQTDVRPDVCYAVVPLPYIG